MKTSLLSGESCKPNTSLNNGVFELQFQDDFNLVVYKDENVYWASESGSVANIGKECELVMELGGNLKIGTHWESGTDGNPGAFLKLEDNGVAKIYTADGINVLWATNALPSDDNVLVGDGCDASSTDLGETWMSRLPDNTKTASLSIPGTHNTCATCDAFFSIPLITQDTAKCQKYDLEPQLRMGVRFLDIRLKRMDILSKIPPPIPFMPTIFDPIYVLKVYHGAIEQDITFSKVLDICNDFLQRNPQEIIFMSVKDEGDSIATMADAAMQAAGVVTAPNMPETLGAARGKIVLLRRYKDSTLGVNLYDNFPDNEVKSDLIPSGAPYQQFYVQDVYEPENYDGYKGALEPIAVATKTRVVRETLAAAASAPSGTHSTFYLNFASAVFYCIDKLFVRIPDTVLISRPVNAQVVTYLKTNPQAKTGFLIVDWMTPEIAHLILNRNMSLVP